MTDHELRDMAVRAAMAAMGQAPAVDPFVAQEELRGEEVSAGHHGMQTVGGTSSGSFALTVTKKPDGKYVLKVGPGFYSMARTYYYVEGTKFDPFDSSGWIVLKTSMTSTSAELTFHPPDSSGSFVPDSEYTYTPLYQVDATTGEFQDYRGAPHIQAWE